MNILEIEAEGPPRYVGPFSFRFQAEDWAARHVTNGSWSIITAVSPRELEDHKASLSDTWEAGRAAKAESGVPE